MPKLPDELDPGMVEKIPLDRFPHGRGNKREFETLASRVAAQATVIDDVAGARADVMGQAATADVNSDFNRTIPGAVSEIGGQLGSLAAVDPGRLLHESQLAIGEAETLASDMSPGGASPASIGSGAGSSFEITSWAESGSLPPPSQPGWPPPSQPGAPQPPQQPGEPPPDAPPGEQPGGPPPPPPPPPSPNDIPGGEPSQPPDEPDEILI